MKISNEQWWHDYVPRRFQRYRLATSPQPELAAKVRLWLEGDPATTGENLVLLGPTGTGKTGMAVGAMRELHEAGRLTAIINVPEWLKDLRPGGETRSFANLRWARTAETVDLLVLDDIGAEKTSEWVQEQLYLLINRRYEDCLPTIATSNLMDYQGLEQTIGTRAASRLCEQATVLGVTGADLRMTGVPA